MAFGIAEVVGQIVQHLTQAELAQLAGLNLVVRGECERLLYHSLVIANLVPVDDRLSSLIGALERRAGQAKALSLSCAPRAFPDYRTLKALFTRLDSITSLTLAGKTGL